MHSPPRPLSAALRIAAIFSAAVLIGGYIVLAQRQANPPLASAQAPTAIEASPPHGDPGLPAILASSSKNGAFALPIHRALSDSLHRDTPDPRVDASSPQTLMLETLRLTPRHSAPGEIAAPARPPVIMPGSKTFTLSPNVVPGVLTPPPNASGAFMLTPQPVLMPVSKSGPVHFPIERILPRPTPTPAPLASPPGKMVPPPIASPTPAAIHPPKLP